MPETSHDLIAVYVDGETKTGKGAAGRAIANALEAQGLQIHYDVAGNFYRRYVAWVRLELNLTDEAPLPVGAELEGAAKHLYKSGQAFKHDNELLGDLQRPAISDSVSKLGKLPIAQQAGMEWWSRTLRSASEENAKVLVLDGRNPRLKVAEATKHVPVSVTVALDLYMTCDAAEAGRRLLRTRGIVHPSVAQLEEATDEIRARRVQDRNRPVHPFVAPAVTIPYDLKNMKAEDALRASWQAQKATELPVAIQIDNTNYTESEMLAGVCELAVRAVDFIKK